MSGAIEKNAASGIAIGVLRPGVLVALAALLSGCGTMYSKDGGFDLVEAQARERLGQDARWLKDEETTAVTRVEVTERLKQPLSADDAMQIALFNNAGLQADYAMLGVSEAERVQAGRLPNPGFHFSRTSGGGLREIERPLSFGVGALLTMPLRVSMETRRFEAAKLAAAADTIETALVARLAYFEAVAAAQQTAYSEQVLDAAQASRDLMNRMARVGTSSRMELAREELFLADAQVALARARQRQLSAREGLVRALSLWGDQLDFALPERLPELPEAPEEIASIEQTALEQRLDVRAGRHSLETLRKSVDLTSAMHFINILEEAGPAQTRERKEDGEVILDGYEISLEIPVFDPGDAKRARAHAVYQQGVNRLRETAINARSQVREAYHAYRTAHDVAKQYRDRIVPLRSEISDAQLLRYNGMLTGVFELIADARDQVNAVNEYLMAARDFWVADTALKSVMFGGGTIDAAMGAMASSMAAGAAAEHQSISQVDRS